MDLLLRLLVLGAWISIGLIIGRKHRRSGTAVLWFAVLGPLGLLMFGYGEWRRGRVGPDPADAAAAATEDLNLPVTVNVDGHWRRGTLQTWALTDLGWHGWAHYELDGQPQAAWFTDVQVRRDASELDDARE